MENITVVFHQSYEKRLGEISSFENKLLGLVSQQKPMKAFCNFFKWVNTN